MSKSDLRELVRRALALSSASEELEVYGLREVRTDLEIRDGAVDALSSSESRGVGVRIVADARQGYASTADVTDEGLRDAVEAARANAAAGEPDDANGLPDPGPVPDLDGLVASGFDATTVDDRVALALGLERAALDTDPRVRGLETVRYVDTRSEAALASTRGLDLAQERTDAFAFGYALVGDGDDTQTGLGLTLGRGPGDLDVDAAGREAATKALRLLGATKPPSRRAAVVFDPWVTAQVLGVLAQALAGDAVVKGRSPYADRVGDTVAAPGVTLLDDGLRRGAPGTAPWDGEGVAHQVTTLIEDGTLQGFLHDTWTARRMGGTSTGNAARDGFTSSPGVAPTNLLLSGGGGSPEDVIAGIDDGVYVQDVMGLHSGVNPISGEFSVSFSGLSVRDGALAEPIREAAVSSTFDEILGGITAVADDLRWFPFGGSLGGATVLVAEMSVSGS